MGSTSTWHVRLLEFAFETSNLTDRSVTWKDSVISDTKITKTKTPTEFEAMTKLETGNCWIDLIEPNKQIEKSYPTLASF